jgi:uncharacterized protein
MFSLQRFLSRDDKFFDLMEGSAEEAHAAIQGLVTMMRAPEEKRTLDYFVEARRKEKRISQELTEQLCRTFVTPLEREDIEALSHALYKIPKTAEKFGERYLRAGKKAYGVDLSIQVELLEKASEVLVLMVKELRRGVELQTVKQQNDQLQLIEGKGDKLMLDALQELYDGKHDPLLVMLMKDLLELLEKLIDRCRDVGNIVFHIILKHS